MERHAVTRISQNTKKNKNKNKNRKNAGDSNITRIRLIAKNSDNNNWKETTLCIVKQHTKASYRR